MKAHLVIALGLALGLMLVVLLVAPAPASQAAVTCQRYVAYEGADTSDCSDMGEPCQSVQYAIDQSADGDRICVSSTLLNPDPTVYYEHITIDHPVILDGKWESQCFVHIPCTFQAMDPCEADRIELDGFGQGRVITILPNADPTIDCFTITGGDANLLGGDPEGNHAGGGIYGRYASPTIINNIITGNFGCDTCTGFFGRGGGIYLLKAGDETLINNNVIAGNVADESTWGQGGGIMLRDSGRVTVVGNLITENRAGHSAGDGGGIAVVGGNPLITGNEVWDNVAGQANRGVGGGIFVWSDSTVTIDGNLIYSNLAINGAGTASLISRGGGIYYAGYPKVLATITRNQIHDNLASPLSPHQGYGGGLYATGLITPSLIAGNTFETNIAAFNDSGDGGGIYLEESEAILEGNTLVGNIASWAGGMGQGGGLFVEDSTVTIRGNDFTANTCGYFGAPATTMGFGGGMAISNTVALVEGNEITRNRATNAPDVGLGGGIYAYTSTMRIVGNFVSENTLTAGDLGIGAGLYLNDSLPLLDGNTITDNEADGATMGRGGGLSLNYCPVFTLTNNIIARNWASQYASGVAVAESTGWIAHNTIANNTGGDGAGVRVYANGHLTAYGNIIYGHEWGIYCEDSPFAPPSTATADYTLFEANTNNYTPSVISTNEILPPALLLPDYHIPLGSNAIDQVPPLAWVTRDIDGHPRPAGAAADAGADERPLMFYLPLVLRAY